jgi:hypothetical protein
MMPQKILPSSTTCLGGREATAEIGAGAASPVEQYKCSYLEP